MKIEFKKGDFAVYESKAEKGKEEVENVKYFDDYNQACEYIVKRWVDETQSTELICGYNREEVEFIEETPDYIRERGIIVREIKSKNIILNLSLFISPGI